jgi:hypothetical protein
MQIVTTTTVTTVEAIGEVRESFELVEFNIRLTTSQCERAIDARKELVVAMGGLNDCIDALEKQGMRIEPDSLQAPCLEVTTQASYRGRNDAVVSYKYEGKCELRWVTPTLEMTAQIYNALVAVEAARVDVSTPRFSLRPGREHILQTQALRVAHETAASYFTRECAVMGKNIGDYTISGWQVGYEGYVREPHHLRGRGRITGPTGPTGSGGPTGASDSERKELLIAIHPGVAVVKVALQVHYELKG